MNSPQRGFYGRAWWGIARAPHRLLLFAASVHGLLLLLLQLAGLLAGPLALPLLSSVFFYGLAGFVLLGCLLYYLPCWLHTSSIGYGVYGSVYNLGFVGLLLLDGGLISNRSLFMVPGLVLLASAWLFAAHALKWTFRWTLRGNGTLNRSILLLLYLVPLSLLVNTVCLLFSSCLIGASLLLLKDLLLVTLLMLGFIAVFAGFTMQHR
ncbi:MAG TPA: hypothetical protein VIN71_08920 [Pseudomonadales bacterium]